MAELRISERCRSIPALLLSIDLAVDLEGEIDFLALLQSTGSAMETSGIHSPALISSNPLQFALMKGFRTYVRRFVVIGCERVSTRVSVDC
ncbi:MAG: hypothetical protein R3D46_04440 [Defluviimonas denitrificans]